ncbi:hypothetical protein [Actinoplanes sp. CA-252034]|uniref:hypothetical protein n=1 Tax=Actinoplanes sp. CA-252034 TaxID=3239906 RepID=UPI003D9527E4
MDELETVYNSPEAGPDSVFRWERRSEALPYVGVVVSIIGEDRCLVVLRKRGPSQFLVQPGVDGDVVVTMRGARVAMPRGAVLPRGHGLEALRSVGDVERLQAVSAWRKLPEWRDDPLHERLGDVVEEAIDKAYELVLAGVEGGPAGLRHLGNLTLLHNAVMSGGVDWVRLDQPPQLVAAGAAGAEYLGLPDLAAVIRRIHTDSDPDYEWRLGALYHEYSGPFGDDAGTIRAAVARRIDVEPQEFGLQSDTITRSRTPPAWRSATARAGHMEPAPTFSNSTRPGSHS